MPPKKATTHLNVRIPQEVKAELEMLATQENVDLATYVRRHFQELLMAKKIHVDAGDRVRVPNPWYPYGYGGGAGPYQMPPMYGQGYPAMSPYPMTMYGARPPSHMDRFLEEMTKMVQVKMMKELLQDRASPEAFIRAAQGKQDGGAFDWDKYLRFNMMQQQHERQMMAATQQLEMARSRGDKGGENQAIQMITALMTANQANQQQFMQQYMAQSQQSSQAQQQMFTTALQTQRQSDQLSREDQRRQDERFEGLRQQFTASQLTSLGQMNQMHVDHMKLEIERIRTEKPKDTLKQMAELIDMRNKNPVYKAAFDAAFGVKEESTIGKLIPQLKELGIDKVIEQVGVAAAKMFGALISKPKIPEPGPPTMPPPGTVVLPKETGEVVPLENLKLPGSSEPPPTQQVPVEKKSFTFTATPPPPEDALKPKTEPQTTQLPPDYLGYTNLSRPQAEEVIEIPVEVEHEAPSEPEEQEKMNEPTASKPPETTKRNRKRKTKR